MQSRGLEIRVVYSIGRLDWDKTGIALFSMWLAAFSKTSWEG